MSDVAIKVENLGKQYRLGEIGTGTLSQDLNRTWARLRGKEDPFARIGEANDRTKKGESDFVWSLKDVNFEVKQGEVLGIIGRNGAGKSTLLKILSKVTAPTTGNVKVRGRIASLLEVGTGFHPELTGRENIFLNGAILGMTKAEIRKKFDEIVDFSGVERYIDTPVKRYSSGMYVRLAFAVAAFLEPEILIIDEVLAVGDAEFQKKCLGRMKDVSVNDGRTVLFVSHNLAAVRELCDTGILLKQGCVDSVGRSVDVIDCYLKNSDANYGVWERHKQLNVVASINKIWITNKSGEIISTIDNSEENFLNISVNITSPKKISTFAFEIRSNTDVSLFCSHDYDVKPQKFEIGNSTYKVKLPDFIRPGNYYINVGSNSVGFSTLEYFENILSFEVIASSKVGELLKDSRPGLFYVPLEWERS